MKLNETKPPVFCNDTCDETRILLTEKCNFKCVFCHNEGNKTNTKHKPTNNPDSLRQSVRLLLENGCRDITFTGGEPLLESKLLVNTLQFIRNFDQKIPVTIVSNISCLNKELIDQFVQLGNIRFNVSFHSPDNACYQKLTGQNHFSLKSLQKKLTELKTHDIAFKMNAVALHETTSDRQHVADIIEFARKQGAMSCKLIELLIVEQNQKLINSHLSIDSIEKNLSDRFHFLRNTPRGKIFADDANFNVELQRCRCSFGCEQCSKISQTASLDSNGMHWSCFDKPECKEPLYKIGYKQTMQKGNEVKRIIVKRYGQLSPSIIREAETADKIAQAWFTFDNNEITKSAELIVQKSIPKNIRSFEAFFFRLKCANNCAKNLPVVAVQRYSHDPENAYLIVEWILLVEKYGLPVNIFTFLDSKPILKGNFQYLERFLSSLGWIQSFNITAKDRQYVYEDAVFSIQIIDDKHHFIYVSLKNEAGIRLAQEIKTYPGVKPVNVPYNLLVASCAHQSK
jgi:molybdenum cofactor biosynthesis enzyme MoaA